MLATFADSNAGKLYGRSCERYGVDPAAFLDDDVLAANLRVALALGDMEAVEPESEFDRARRVHEEAFGG
jgi:hypothetical protein